MIIKVCGMRDADNIHAVDGLEGVTWMGFIFHPSSPRFVSEVPACLPKHCKRVGVFVNESLQGILTRHEAFRFNLIQLHGNEPPDFCQALRANIGEEVSLIKVLPITVPSDLKAALPYQGLADYFLFETKCKGYGGSGKQFDWEVLQGYTGNTPFLIAGGITPADTEKVLSFRHPRFTGIDLNSGFESAPGLKDTAALRDFIHKIHH